MRLISIEQDKNGAHFYCTSDTMTKVPNGWAVVPDDMETPNLPYGEITVEDIDGVPTVTSWTPGVMPEPRVVPDPEPTDTEILNALLGVE